MFKEKPPKKSSLVLERKYLLHRSVEHPTYKAKIVPICILEDNTNIYFLHATLLLSATHLLFYELERYFNFFLQWELN